MISMLCANAKKLTLALSLGTGLAVGAIVLCYRAVHNYLYWNSPFVEVKHLNCTIRGGRYNENRDRNFLVVDELHEHVFLTARAFPRMILLEANVEGEIFTLYNPTVEGETGQVSCNLTEICARNDVRRAKLHSGKETDGIDCGDEVGDFVTNFLDVKGKRKLRVIYFVDGFFTERNLKTLPVYWNNPVPKVNDQIAYADLAAYMAFSTGSLDNLNFRLHAKGEPPVDERFMRPNIVVNNPVPFDEDRWLHMRVGKEVEFVCYKPCTRCILTTVNPDSGKKSITMEPLKELRQYRLAPNGKLLDLYEQSPIFGVNMALIRPGRINVDDPVLIRYKPTPF